MGNPGSKQSRGEACSREAQTIRGKRASRDGWAWWLIVPLGIVSLAYTVLGLTYLTWDTAFSYPVDLRLRWIEERLVWQGADPQVAGHPDLELPSSHEAMRRLGGAIHHGLTRQAYFWCLPCRGS